MRNESEDSAFVYNVGDCRAPLRSARNDGNFHVIAKEELATTVAISPGNSPLLNIQ